MSRFLLLALLLAALCPASSFAHKSVQAGNAGAHVSELGHLQDAAIAESSGIVASRRQPGLYWTHNDSGDGPFVYAVGPHGEKRGAFRLRGVDNVTDCEDIAIGPGPRRGAPYLYVADIGDNDKKRDGCVVYRVPEPGVTAAARTSTPQLPVLTAQAEAFRFVYPDGPHNAETLLVHPRTGRVYVIAKNKSGRDGVYAFPVLDASRVATLTKVAAITISGEPSFNSNLVTGGDISPDGAHAVVRTYWYAYEYTMPRGSRAFDSLWKTTPQRIMLPLQPQGEGICYTYPKGEAFILTSEGKNTSLYEAWRK